jgi:transporter family-2 protein
MGIIFSIIAGALMSIQGVFNTRAGDKIGSWETNLIVQGSGLILTIIIVLIIGNGNFHKIKEVNKLYFLGGIIGVFIIYSVMMGIKNLGATYSIAVILISQLITAAVIDCCGLFDTNQVSFHFTKIIGVLVMIAGIIIGVIGGLLIAWCIAQYI